MYQISTFAMYHPDHGECVADETCEANLLELGWKRESATGSDDSDKDLQDGESTQGEGASNEGEQPSGDAPAKGAKAKGAKA